jgi:hypothetical protein
MANANTFTSLSGGTGDNQIPSQTLAATTETEFQKTTGTTTAVAVLSIPLGTAIAGSASPQNPSVNAALIGSTGRYYGLPTGASRPSHTATAFESRPFLVRITGLATPASDAGNTLAVILYLGTTKSGTAIGTTATVAQATTTTAKHFIMEAQLMWDSTSQAVTGQYWFSLPGTSGTVYSTWKTLASAGSTIALTGLNFCASATWGNAVGGVVAVKEFSISEL